MKINPFSQAESISLEPKASVVVKLEDNEAVSVRDEASADEEVVKSDKYV